MSKVDLSIIIVNWKVRDLLANCLDSILKYKEDLNLEIIVVDNDSRDGSPEMIMGRYPQIKMISLAKNYGFAKANNIALNEAKGDLFLLLNPDTEVLPGFFQKAIAYMEDKPEVGIMGPRILNPDKSIQNSIRRSPSLLSQILILLKLKKVLPNNKIIKNYLAKDFDYEKEQSAEQIMGAAMFVRKDVIDQIGMLDENFFIWFEEVDFCHQANKAGINIKYFPDVQLMHHEGASFSKKRIILKQLIFNKSLLYYFWKNKPLWQWFVILIFIPVNILLTILYVIFLSEKKL